MQRTILSFFVHEDGEHAARLDCGHTQPVRSGPPLHDPQEGPLDCLKCDRLEMPDDAQPYKSTPWFDENTVPKGLLANHRTRTGVWGRVEVTDGSLGLVSEEPPLLDVLLDMENPGVVAPGHPHRVVIDGPVRFRVVFHRAAAVDPVEAPHVDLPAGTASEAP